MITKACGIIIFRINKNQKYFLLIKQYQGHWGFPKGHQENGEDDLITAKREVQEETGLDKIIIVENFQTSEKYQVNNNPKEVVYFVGETKEFNISIQPEEVNSYCWLEESQVLEKLTFNGSKKCFVEALKFISFKN